MMKEISSYRFPGFYNSFFCYPEEFIDDEHELEDHIKEHVLGDVEVVYEYGDNFKEYKKEVCQTFLNYYVDKIIEVLPYEITNRNVFEFEIIDDENNIKVYSPTYYNYGTDRCYCWIKTNKITLEMISNQIEDWMIDITEYEDNMFIALLDMLISLSDCTGFEDIIESTYYDIDKYYYAEPVVYCNKEVAEAIKEHYSPNLKFKIING